MILLLLLGALTLLSALAGYYGAETRDPEYSVGALMSWHPGEPTTTR